MKLSDILAKLTGLESRLAAIDKAEFSALKTIVEGELSAANTKIGDLESQLSAANTKNTELSGKVTDLTNQTNQLGNDYAAVISDINAVVTNLKLDLPADATPKAKIDAIQNSVNAAVAKTGVNIVKLPGAPASTATANGSQTVTLAQFRAMTPQAKSEFCKAGGKITE